MIEKIKKYLESKTKKYEIFFQELEKETFSFEKNQEDAVINGKINGLSIRVIKNNKVGFSSTTNIKNYKACAKKAIQLSKLSNIKINNFPSKKKYSKIKAYSGSLFDYSIKKVVNEIVSTAKKKGLFSSGMYFKIIDDLRIINSNGLDINQKEAQNIFFYSLIDKNNNEISSYLQSLFPIKEPELNEALQRLKDQKIKQIPRTSEMRLLLHPEAAKDIIADTLSSSIDAEQIQKNRSFLTNKINKKIFDTKLTIIDNAIEKGLLNSRSFDSEGIPSQKTIVFKDGVFKSALYNLETAQIENKKSTGNALRSYNTSSLIFPTNFIFLNGKKSINDIISQIKEGIYVRGVMGAHTIQDATGEFSLVVNEGKIIKNGAFGPSVKDTMVAGNVFDLLKEIEEIENKTYHTSSGFYLPHLLFPKVNVIGK